MIIYMTSSPSGGIRPTGKQITTGLDYDNGFVEQLHSDWKENSRFLIISAFPDSFEGNDEMRAFFEKIFNENGLTTSVCEICDYRDLSFVSRLNDYDVIMLSGGHVPTELAFFREIHLKEAFADFDGIVIGVSAGTMNMADTVYAIPEMPGEAADPSFERFVPGLGLTDLMIIPHFLDIKDDILDDRHMTWDIACPDSHGRKFYALVDGSYILLKDGQRTLYGEAYLISDGTVKQICAEGETLSL